MDVQRQCFNLATPARGGDQGADLPSQRAVVLSRGCVPVCVPPVRAKERQTLLIPGPDSNFVPCLVRFFPAIAATPQHLASRASTHPT